MNSSVNEHFQFCPTTKCHAHEIEWFHSSFLYNKVVCTLLFVCGRWGENCSMEHCLLPSPLHTWSSPSPGGTLQLIILTSTRWNDKLRFLAKHIPIKQTTQSLCIIILSSILLIFFVRLALVCDVQRTPCMLLPEQLCSYIDNDINYETHSLYLHSFPFR